MTRWILFAPLSVALVAFAFAGAVATGDPPETGLYDTADTGGWDTDTGDTGSDTGYYVPAPPDDYDSDGPPDCDDIDEPPGVVAVFDECAGGMYSDENCQPPLEVGDAPGPDLVCVGTGFVGTSFSHTPSGWIRTNFWACTLTTL